MPLRGDFETEFDQDADLLLADMEYFDDDTPEDIKLKNDVIELYNARLDERIKRKKFVIERNLLDIKKIQKQERKRTKEERDIINTMKIFARFQQPDEHERLVNSLIRERMLREVIDQLRFFKSKGLTTIDQIEKYIEVNKSRTATAIDPKKGETSTSHRFEATEDLLSNPNKYVSRKEASSIEQAVSDSKQYQNVDISTAPKFCDLDHKERLLCCNINLKPEDYLVVKERILKLEAKMGYVQKTKVEEVCKSRCQRTD